MNMVPTIKDALHHMHDSTVKATHATGHLFHEKTFWGILAIIALIALLFTLVVLYGSSNALPTTPLPFAPYY